jgi:hypothetical protein
MNLLNMLRLLSIDPGVTHLGWCVARGRTSHGVSSGTKGASMEVLAHGTEDTTRPCRVPGCAIPKTRELWDRLGHTWAHTLREHAEAADHVLVERQPPGGLGEVVSFVYERVGLGKIVRIHPRSMHKFYGIGHYDYDGRKVCTEAIAANWIPDLRGGGDERVHDVADAVAMAWFFLSTRAPPPPPAVAPHDWMDAFRHDSP